MVFIFKKIDGRLEISLALNTRQEYMTNHKLEIPVRDTITKLNNSKTSNYHNERKFS
jgi:hypothetical protein